MRADGGRVHQCVHQRHGGRLAPQRPQHLKNTAGAGWGASTHAVVEFVPQLRLGQRARRVPHGTTDPLGMPSPVMGPDRHHREGVVRSITRRRSPRSRQSSVRSASAISSSKAAVTGLLTAFHPSAQRSIAVGWCCVDSAVNHLNRAGVAATGKTNATAIIIAIFRQAGRPAIGNTLSCGGVS